MRRPCLAKKRSLACCILGGVGRHSADAVESVGNGAGSGGRLPYPACGCGTPHSHHMALASSWGSLGLLCAWSMSRMEPLLMQLRSCATQPIGLGRKGGALPMLGSSYSRPEILEKYVSTQLDKVVRRSSIQV